MDSRCLFVNCGNEALYSCICSSKILLCAVHYIKHIKEPGIHLEIDLLERKRLIKMNAADRALNKTKIKIIDIGQKLISSITKSIREIKQNIGKRKEHAKNIISSNSLDKDTEKDIENLIAAKHDIKNELKESLSEFIGIFNDKQSQNPDADQELKKNNQVKSKKKLC